MLVFLFRRGIKITKVDQVGEFLKALRGHLFLLKREAITIEVGAPDNWIIDP